MKVRAIAKKEKETFVKIIEDGLQREAIIEGKM